MKTSSNCFTRMLPRWSLPLGVRVGQYLTVSFMTLCAMRLTSSLGRSWLVAMPYPLAAPKMRSRKVERISTAGISMRPVI